MEDFFKIKLCHFMTKYYDHIEFYLVKLNKKPYFCTIATFFKLQNLECYSISGRDLWFRWYCNSTLCRSANVLLRNSLLWLAVATELSILIGCCDLFGLLADHNDFWIIPISPNWRISIRIGGVQDNLLDNFTILQYLRFAAISSYLIKIAIFKDILAFGVLEMKMYSRIWVTIAKEFQFWIKS